MAEKHEGVNGSAGDPPPVRDLGHWPNINLIMAEDEDFYHQGSSLSHGEGDASDDESSGPAAAPPRPRWVLRIHTEIDLKNRDNYDAIARHLAKRDKFGRRDAHAILKEKGLLKDGSDTGKAMVAAALDSKP